MCALLYRIHRVGPAVAMSIAPRWRPSAQPCTNLLPVGTIVRQGSPLPVRFRQCEPGAGDGAGSRGAPCYRAGSGGCASARTGGDAGGYRATDVAAWMLRAAVRIRSVTASGCEIITTCDELTSTVLSPQARWAMKRTLAVPIVLSCVATMQ